MSDQLRAALREMKGIVDSPSAAPVTYLHDPETGESFAALVTIPGLDKVEKGTWNYDDHDHREGDEDE